MQKAHSHLQRYWKSHWGPLLGIATGLFFIGLQWSSPHVGDPCSRLGDVAQEWRIGVPARQIMCVATVDDKLLYDRPIMPQQRRTKLAALNQSEY
ncbi:MAG TPA: hypothetical protein VF007_06545 [Stellaceae bacterium]